MTDDSKPLLDCENLYKNQKVESMPGYNENLDTDLVKELDDRKIYGGEFLDLGTGLWTQAIKLYQWFHCYRIRFI